MKLQDMRDALNDYCGRTGCKNCVLPNNSWSNPESCGALNIAEAGEVEAIKALEMIGYKEESRIDAPSNPYWDRITAVANRQRSKGIREYGKGVEDDTADINVRLDRIEEELIDALMYLEHLRDGINRIKEVVG